MNPEEGSLLGNERQELQSQRLFNCLIVLVGTVACVIYVCLVLQVTENVNTGCDQTFIKNNDIEGYYNGVALHKNFIHFITKNKCKPQS